MAASKVKINTVHATTSRTHGENRGYVCLLCFQKPLKAELNKTIWIVQGVQLERVHKYFMSNYDPSDQRYANGICGSCKTKLSKIDQFEQAKEKAL